MAMFADIEFGFLQMKLSFHFKAQQKDFWVYHDQVYKGQPSAAAAAEGLELFKH